MTATTLRQSLHNYLEIADSKKIKAIYTILQEEIEENSLEYTLTLKKELDNRYANYKSGKTEMLTAKESKNRVQQLLKTNTK